jgi:hypothetical protein
MPYNTVVRQATAVCSPTVVIMVSNLVQPATPPGESGIPADYRRFLPPGLALRKSFLNFSALPACGSSRAVYS